MRATLIIAYYKNLPFLDLILQSLAFQSEKKFEVIIAEDDNDISTVSFIEKQNIRYSFPILQVSQDNNGFRKNKILNKAINKASSEYLIFIDGDCVLHKHFIREHLKNAEQNLVLIGRRLMLSEKLTRKALDTNDFRIFNFYNFMSHQCKKLDCAVYFPLISSKRNHGIWGCNWSLSKKALFDINGFDEDYIKAGVGEDVDVEWRLRENSLKFKALKFKAIQYHLDHKENYSNDDVNFNFKILEQKKKLKNIYCLNGLIK